MDTRGGRYTSHEEETDVEQSHFYGDVNYNFLSGEGFSELGEPHPNSGQSTDNVFTPDTPTAVHQNTTLTEWAMNVSTYNAITEQEARNLRRTYLPSDGAFTYDEQVTTTATRLPHQQSQSDQPRRRHSSRASRMTNLSSLQVYISNLKLTNERRNLIIAVIFGITSLVCCFALITFVNKDVNSLKDDRAKTLLEREALQESLRNKISKTKQHDDITFTISETSANTSGVEYLPELPDLYDYTVCLWVTPFHLGRVSNINVSKLSLPTLVSIERKRFLMSLDSINHFWLNIGIKSKRYKNYKLPPNKSTHICLSTSTKHNKLELFYNGLSYNVDEDYFGPPIPRGSFLSLGNRQLTTLTGDCCYTDVFRGNITNFVIFPRLLTNEEVYNIAHNCIYPVDVIVRPQLPDVSLHGGATATILDVCPTRVPFKKEEGL